MLISKSTLSSKLLNYYKSELALLKADIDYLNESELLRYKCEMEKVQAVVDRLEAVQFMKLFRM